MPDALARRTVTRVYVLQNGPRAGQLVDDLPAGYRAATGTTESDDVVFDEFTARRAIWSPDT